MISLAPIDLMAEIRDAESLRKKHLDAWSDVIGRLVGNKWRSDHAVDATPENYPFGYLATMRPQLVWDSPVVEVQPDRAVTDWATADGLEVAMNHWIKTTRYKARVLDNLVNDALIGFGVTKTGIEYRGDYGKQGVEGDFALRPMVPYVTRVSPRNFIIDADCGGAGGPTAARLVGHCFERDIEDLQADERYDPAMTAQLVPTDVDSLESDGDAFKTRDARESDRKRVTLYELYLPEHQKIVTIADRNGGMVLRSDDYYGPPEGPYTLWGLYVVPDQVYPLSPLVACWEQFEALNDHATALASEAASHKKIAIYKKSAKEDAKAIKGAKSGDIVGLDHPEDVQDFEIGGPSAIKENYVDRLRENLDRALAFSDANRGVANAETATANSLAASGSNIRIDGMRQKVEECAQGDLRKVGWYMFHTQGVQMRISRQNEQTGQMQEGMFMGGPWQGGFVKDNYVPAEDPDMAWPDFCLNVLVGSMEKKDDALEQARAQDEWQLTMALAQLFISVYGPQAIQQFNWRRILDRHGRMRNEREYSKIIFVDQVGSMGMIPPDPLSMMASHFPQQGGQAGTMGFLGQQGIQPSIGGLPPALGQTMLGGMGASPGMNSIGLPQQPTMMGNQSMGGMAGMNMAPSGFGMAPSRTPQHQSSRGHGSPRPAAKGPASAKPQPGATTFPGLLANARAGVRR